jgi:predicted nuclease with TOPRIM domain
MVTTGQTERVREVGGLPNFGRLRARSVWGRAGAVKLMSVSTSESEDHDALARELEQEASKLKDETERLEDEISDVRTDWESKRQDPAVPGAPEPVREDDARDEENPKDKDAEDG